MDLLDTLLATAAAMGHNLESMGISVIPCMGKNNMDRPAIVFRQFEICTFLIWDNDKERRDAKPEENRRLLRLVGAAEEDWPVCIRSTHACLDHNLEYVLRKELPGGIYDHLLDEARKEFRMEKQQAQKNPFVVRRIVEKAAASGEFCETLRGIVTQIVKMRISFYGDPQ